jgi:hypothetical protein
MGYEGTNDAPERIALIFEGVEAFQFSYLLACTPAMLDAYAKLVDRGSTEWLTSIQSAVSRNGGAFSPQLKHLMILFDDGPCYEAVCRSFRIETSSSR